MSVSDAELIRFIMPWIGLGFVAALILGFLLDVRGAIGAFGLGTIAPALVYLPPPDDPSIVNLALGTLRGPIPFSFNGLGSLFLAELTLDWWIGAAFGAALAIVLRRWRLA